MRNLKKSLLPITTFARIDLKRLFRDKVAIFFVFVFPLIFLLIFGSIFNGDNNVSFRVGLINNSNSEFSKEFEKQLRDNKVFEIDKEISSIDMAKEKMSRGQLDATITLPAEFGDNKDGKYPAGQAKVLYEENNEQGGRTLASIMEGMFKEINQDLVPHDEPFSVKASINRH